MAELTHVDEQGKAHMVDVGDKAPSRRVAVASAVLRTRPDVIRRIADNEIAKGDVLGVARVAGILAAKKTHELIPLCHPLRIDQVQVELRLGDDTVGVRATVAAFDRTGVEMEAMTAASVAALTVYDMCKAVDREMQIEAVRLEEKSGGRSGHFVRKAG